MEKVKKTLDENRLAELMAPVCEVFCCYPADLATQDALDAACASCYVERLVRLFLSGGDPDDLA